jgi:hypothetical protein
MARRPRITVTAVNKALAAREDTAGVELVRASGYFYFVGDAVCFASTTSVMVPRVGDLPVEEWVAEAVGFVSASTKAAALEVEK